MSGIAATMRDACANELTWHDAVAAAERTWGVDGEAAVDDAIRHGALTEAEEGGLSFGIPSFHRHMRLLAERAAR